MKNFVRFVLQKTLSFKNYLFLFSLYSIKIFEMGKYEREFLYFLGLIKDKGIILDVGANIGITAAPLARRFQHAEIHAFEPISENFSTLSRIVKYLKLDNTKLFNIALGSYQGTLKMIMPEHGNSRMQGLSKAYEEGSNEPGVIYNVPIKRLDDLYPDNTNIQAIKIDVENFELEVLKGAQTLLAKNKPLIYCELWDNENRTKVFEMLTAIGYEIFVYNQQSGKLQQPEIKTGVDGDNYFFIHPVTA